MMKTDLERTMSTLFVSGIRLLVLQTLPKGRTVNGEYFFDVICTELPRESLPETK
jgi:hypothetical protein